MVKIGFHPPKQTARIQNPTVRIIVLVHYFSMLYIRVESFFLVVQCFSLIKQ